MAGGETRADSVRAGLAEVPADAVVVLVHDAARPLLPDAVIERVLAPLSEGWDGAVPGLPVADTLKRVGPDGAVVETVARDSLWAVQTPQAFPADVLRRAYATGADATDCAGLVEAAGGRVTVVEGDPLLLKVTEDGRGPGATVTWSGDAGTYDVDQTVAIACASGDNLSDVARSISSRSSRMARRSRQRGGSALRQGDQHGARGRADAPGSSCSGGRGAASRAGRRGLRG